MTSWVENGGHLWAVLWREITTSFIDIMQASYTGRARSRLASLHKKKEHLNASVLTILNGLFNVTQETAELWLSPMQTVMAVANAEGYGCRQYRQLWLSPIQTVMVVANTDSYGCRQYRQLCNRGTSYV
jgi:hypothetical protein